MPAGYELHHHQMPREPIPLTGRSRRLKSLSEFAPPYWLGVFKAQMDKRPSLLPAILAGLAIGVVLGLAIVV